jgi:hypothetical protein
MRLAQKSGLPRCFSEKNTGQSHAQWRLNGLARPLRWCGITKLVSAQRWPVTKMVIFESVGRDIPINVWRQTEACR